ncbi:MAG: SGNH/GDSL hydrolase family protein, partial [Planctomycetaceae bacterium]|nr:SGNH/GDSL hydrolase family protein [Planctomycetaceae bacterium]
MHRVCLAALVWSLVFLPLATRAETLELKDGDRVALIGSTMIEREQRYGYWETMLTSRYPGRNIQFRNLGWSGDTVWGEARAGFGTPADGYKLLIEHVEALKPTVIFLSYGLNESFAGDAGLSAFDEQFQKLLKDLSTHKPRIAVIAPFRIEQQPAPLPDPEAANKNLWHYVSAMHEATGNRDHLWMDMKHLVDRHQAGDNPLRLTENGLHFSPLGYWVTAGMLENELQFAPSGWHVELEAQGKALQTAGTKLADVQASERGLQFTLTSNVLPTTAALRNPGHSGVLAVKGLKPGKYQLWVDGLQVAEGTHEQWSSPVGVDD